MALWLTVALGGCDDGNREEDISVTHDAYFAVLSDNYEGAVVVSLLGQDGEVVEEAWLSPRIKDGELRTPFTEDVVLPTVSPSRRYVTAIERGLGVVSRVDLEEGEIVGQLKTDAEPEGDDAMFLSNPQDVVYVDDTLAWVTRWGVNPNDDAEKAERGNDLIAFDPSTMERLDRRVNLSSFDETVTETEYDDDFNPIGEVENTAFAHPVRIVLANGHMAVGMDRTTDTAFTPAQGATAIVDPMNDEISDRVDHEGLKNCRDVYPVAGADDRVLVGCIGDWAFLGPETGIVMLEIDDDGRADVVESFRVADHDDAVATGQLLASLGGDCVFAVASGASDFMTGEVTTPDRGYIVDLGSGEQTMVLESDGAFSLGTPAFDPDSGLLLVPDAGDFGDPRYGVWRMQLEDDCELREDGFVEVAPSETLAARQVHLL
jgi:hypothetical protein